ncbi:MAG: hypothetical protein HZC40_07750 [Chloroflexi bacterium]|nr:hypothetical protein [Chloroflexota bacterium]
MFDNGLLWFIVGIGATLAVFGFNEWLNEKQVSFNWWQWVLTVGWVLFLAFTIAFTTINLAAQEIRAGVWGLVILGIVAVVWATLGWYFVLRQKFAKTA